MVSAPFALRDSCCPVCVENWLMKKLLIFTLSLALCGAANSQTAAQKSAARQTFAQFRALNQSKKLNTTAARALVTGEAKEYVKSPQLGPMSAPDALVFPSPTRAVARVQALDDKGKSITDVYFTLQREGANWKVSALRALALTGIIEAARDELKTKKNLNATERNELANLNLLLSLDADLKRHFTTNQSAFEQLARAADQPKLSASIQVLQRQLHLNAGAPQSGKNGSRQWIVGGIIDNLVGYGYSPSGALPPISTEDTIWVERLSPRWYFFRTT